MNAAPHRQRLASRMDMRGEQFEEERLLEGYPQKQFPDSFDILDAKTDFSASIRNLADSFRKDHAKIDAEVNLTDKVIIVGDANCGKTSMALRATEDRFQEDYRPTIGVSFLAKKYSILGCPVVVTLWDTAGQERFRSLSTMYYRGAKLCMICFDVSDPDTFVHAREVWYPEVKEKAPGVCMFLLGLKSDLYRAVTRQDALRFAREIGAEYCEVSAKLGSQIVELFDRVAVFVFEHCLLKYESERAALDKKEALQMHPDKSHSKKKKKNCCN
eukprot:ANDGO_08126.mRNA.1 hypothetical protein